MTRKYQGRIPQTGKKENKKHHNTSNESTPKRLIQKKNLNKYTIQNCNVQFQKVLKMSRKLDNTSKSNTNQNQKNSEMKRQKSEKNYK